MNNKYDNLTKYKKAVLSDYIKSSDIMKEITLPDFVYKYRKFDIRYLKESLDGKVFFSTPADMNVNDPYDCQMDFDEKQVFLTMFPGVPDKVFDENPAIFKMLNDYKQSLQRQVRIGCFTTCDCSKIEMWDNEYFGDKHRGYCIKYKVDPLYFYPATIVFLKVLYDNNGFNATEVMKNFVEWVKLGQEQKKNSQSYRVRTAKMVCLGHNHTLFKPEKYKNEEEWRIIIPENRFIEYFGEENIYTKDFSSLIHSVYLGSEFKKADKDGKMYNYALEVCKRNQIPLYIMQQNGDKFEEKGEYDPMAMQR